MTHRTIVLTCSAGMGLLLAVSGMVNAAPKTVVAARSSAPSAFETRYESALAALRADIAASLPAAGQDKVLALKQATAAVKGARAAFEAAQQNAAKIQTAKALVDHAKGKWLGGAEKGIAQAEAALKSAKTEADREKANKDLAKWQADKQAGLKALQERQAALDAAKVEEPKVLEAQKAAQASLAKAVETESRAAADMLASVAPFLSSDKLDAKLVKCAVLAEATPQGMAEFAQSGGGHEALLEKLLSDASLMKEMLIAGGASGGRYGQAMQIFTAIQKAGGGAHDGALRRLALATALEHAVPVAQSNPKDQAGAATTIDPVKRYQHYEKAFLAGELDPAFKDFSAWEYRMVVNCDAPDEILSWGREMLRTYRPDHVTNPDYGWRYVASVRTDVSYGSENVSKDMPNLHSYQNIPLNGGVCGRRAFYGRFILRSFGIPVWGVTQHKHAALSHWTPKGWVVNLGAGFNASWWDKDGAPRSGTDFLLETQARAQGADYLKVLRAQWASRALGEESFNERKKIEGGFWSNLAQHQAAALASKAVELGPLGKELAEANEPKGKEKLEKVSAAGDDRKVVSSADGEIVIPSVAHEKTSGAFASMKSHSGGQQVYIKGGYKAQYLFDAPREGKYQITARVATFTDGQKLLFAANDSKQTAEAAVPFTIGLWQMTRPVEVSLNPGRNILTLEFPAGSRGLSLKELTIHPVRN